MRTPDNPLSPQHVLFGERTDRVTIVPDEVLCAVCDRIRELKAQVPVETQSLRELKQLFASDCRLYYTAAAVSRRARLSARTRQKLLSELYPLRSTLEKAITACFPLVANQRELIKNATGKSFFGVSAKQGVSVRYGLSSCVPTKACGGRCYGHDGRDRELHILFRACLNQYIGVCFEEGGEEAREEILRQLGRAIEYGVESARRDAENSLTESGFRRQPRIRFSHIGEMVHTPDFTNALARAIRAQAPDVICVLYTRHPRAAEIDPDLITVNFTIERSDDPRLKYAPKNARLVNAAWDGKVLPDVAVNFLEHHVGRTAAPDGLGVVCPVTANHSETPSCDSAGCDLCFRSLLEPAVSK